jgi:hypothetical protein
LFEELESLLFGGDSKCLELIGDLRLIPGCEELTFQMEYFEFEQALKTLARLKEELG